MAAKKATAKAKKKTAPRKAVRKAKPVVKETAAPVIEQPPVERDCIPLHQWTHDGDKVLLVKCVEAGGLSHGGFQWPKSGTVKTPNWSKAADCDSGGLFGWPWGLNLGGGKNPIYHGDWIVFAASPDSVVDLGDKAKAGPTAEILYYGPWAGALAFTLAGRLTWLDQRIRVATENAIIRRGKVEVSSDEDSGAATASGDSGAATASGFSGAATASGFRGAATASGFRGAATASGFRGAATASGFSGAATASGDSGAATASGDSGAATASGDSGAATASGFSGAATASGFRGAATASGFRGAASITGECSTIELSPTSVGAVNAEEFYWVVRTGAILLQRWPAGHQLFTSEGRKDGATLRIVRGVVMT